MKELKNRSLSITVLGVIPRRLLMNSAGLFRKLARSGLQNLAPYKPGAIEELEREIGRGTCKN